MFSFLLSFSKPRIISIVLLLAILVISLLFTSYTEGMASDASASGATLNDATKTVNDSAPTAKTSDNKGPLSLTTDSVKPSDGILLGSGSSISVSDITGVLQNNPGVQKLITNKP